MVFLTLIQISANAQQIYVTPTYSCSSYNKFQNNIGYEIGFLHPIKLKSRFGFSFSQSFKNTEYSYTSFSDGNGKTYHRNVKPKNQKLNLSLEYSFNILNKQKSSFFIGPRIGLNYFKINESIMERPINEDEDYIYTSNYGENNNIGFGLLFEYEHKVFSDKFSVFVSTEPEVIFYSKLESKGSSDPALIGLVNFNLGLRYNLKKK